MFRKKKAYVTRVEKGHSHAILKNYMANKLAVVAAVVLILIILGSLLCDVFFMAARIMVLKPGRPKTCSVIIAPPSRPAKFMPSCVTTGIKALRRPWHTTTRVGLQPLARAVRM